MKEGKFPILRTVLRTVIIWASEVLALAIMVWIFPGIYIDSWLTGIIYVAAVGVLNALLWPILSRFFLPFMVITLGFGSLLLNAFVLWLAMQFFQGMVIENFWTLIFVALGMALTNIIVSSLLTIDDDATYYRNVLYRRTRRARTKEGKGVKTYPGVIFLEIDGLAEEILQSALQEGYLPTLSKWLKNGTHKIMAWETDTSCQTGASQAGILHGSNDNMPAFRWVEKENDGAITTTSGPWDTPVIEERHSDGNGLLAGSGYSRSNMFSGDAVNAIFTYSRLTSGGSMYTPSFYAYFSSPYNFIRTIGLVVWEIGKEIRSQRRQEREDIQPRLDRKERGGPYPFMRAFTNVIMRDMNTYTLIGDIYEGEADAIYCTYAAYDETAHHSGIRDEDALDELAQLDRQFARLEHASQISDRPYKFVVLSDHGQTQGATFKQRYGESLEEYIGRILPEEMKVYEDVQVHEDWGQLSAVMTDLAEDDEHGLTQRLARRSKERYYKDMVMMGPTYERVKQEKQGVVVDSRQAEVIVLASGNLGLVYFTDWEERISYEDMERAMPGFIEALVKHEGVGFVMVRSSEHGAMVIGEQGTNFLDEDRIEGKNPLEDFRPRAPQHLKRTDGFKYCPDILVNSFYDPDTEEGAAFEELLGFHGGLGGPQTAPFILYPTEWELGNEEIVGAEQVYKVFKKHIQEQQTEIPAN